LDTWVDAANGETREALVRDGRAIALRIMRASDEGRRARWGEVYQARVKEIDQRRRGAFLDLGLSEQQGFLPLGDDGKARLKRERAPLSEGANISVLITREAARGKNPIVSLQAMHDAGAKPGRIAQHECDENLAQAKAATADVRVLLDEAIELALAKQAAIPGGGALIIEPTAALTSIDVDAGKRQGSGDPERFALDLNIAAALEAARQIRLRNLGGIIAIDFVSMRAKVHQQHLEQAVRTAFASDPWGVQFGGLSRFGVYELSRAQLCTPLHEVLCDEDGQLSAETIALMALRAIDREAAAQGGRRIVCVVAPEVKSWLDAGHIPWADALTNRIGPRWALEAAPGPRDKIDVRAL
jgi:Ribonuclease G/E